MKINKYIQNRLIHGKAYTSPKYKWLQCGEYLNNEFLKIREMGTYLSDAKADITKYPVDTPQTGDCVFMDYGITDKDGKKIPHKAIIEATDGDWIWLTEANLAGNGVVTHGRKIKNNDRRIIGYARVPLNLKTLQGQPTYEVPEWAKYAVNKAKKNKIVMNWDNPNETIGTEKLEWILENLGIFDAKKHEGSVSLLRFVVGLDKLGLLDF